VLLGYLQDDEFVGLEAMFSQSGRSLFSVKVLSTEIEYFELDASFQSFLNLNKLKESLVQGLSFKLAYRVEYLAKKLDYSSVKKAMPHKVEGFSSDIASHKLLKQMELEASGPVGSNLLRAAWDADKSKLLAKFTRTQDPRCQAKQAPVSQSQDKQPSGLPRTQSIGRLGQLQQKTDSSKKLSAGVCPEVALGCPGIHNRRREQSVVLEENLRPSHSYFISNLFSRPAKRLKSKGPKRPSDSVHSQQPRRQESPENTLLPQRAQSPQLQQISAFPDARFLAKFRKTVLGYSQSHAPFVAGCELSSSCTVEKKVAASALRAMRASKPQSLNASQSAEGLKLNFRIKSPTPKQKPSPQESSLLTKSAGRPKQPSKAVRFEGGQPPAPMHRRQSTTHLDPQVQRD